MKLIQMRKGQFVFFKNELHKVYSIKPVFRKSVHLYRLKDMKQILTRANQVTYHRPKHGDTFIFYSSRYTIDQDSRPSSGDYILIIKPAPDLLSHYTLNAIEKVEKVEKANVVTTRDNAVKHHEYVVLVPGWKDQAQEIAYFDKSVVTEDEQQADESTFHTATSYNGQPVIGDVYFDKEKETNAMVVAITKDHVTFGHGVTLTLFDLMNEEKYSYINRFED